MIGVFGWLDTPAPLLTYLVWYVAIGVVVLLALSSTHARGNVALLFLVALVVLVPMAISYREAHRLGLFWQGRYTLPMATGIPVLATALIDGTAVLGAIRSRLTVLLCIGSVWLTWPAFTRRKTQSQAGFLVRWTSCTVNGPRHSATAPRPRGR